MNSIANKTFSRAAMAAALAGALALGGCGHSDKASDAATPINVEMPAEAAISQAGAGAVPVADPSVSAAGAAVPSDPGHAAADQAAQDAAAIKAAADAAAADAPAKKEQ